MSLLLVGAHAVRLDEPCFWLSEKVRKSPTSKGWRRIQALYVIRDDKPALFELDLGPAKNFTAQEFQIPGGVQETNGRIDIFHTVGELRDIADYFRSGLYQPPEIEPTDLIGGYYDELDQRRRWGRKLTVSGPHGWLQRN